MFREKLLKVREYSWAKQIVYNFVLALFFALIICVVMIKAMSLRLDEVLSDSMYPVFTDQDVVIVKPKDNYEIGDIIEYKDGKANVTHRIVGYDPATGVFKTQGDHNGSADGANITKDMIRGEVVAIWFNGRNVYHFVKDNYFLLLTMVVGAWVLSVTFTNELEVKKHNILKI